MPPAYAAAMGAVKSGPPTQLPLQQQEQKDDDVPVKSRSPGDIRYMPPAYAAAIAAVKTQEPSTQLPPPQQQQPQEQKEDVAGQQHPSAPKVCYLPVQCFVKPSVYYQMLRNDE